MPTAIPEDPLRRKAQARCQRSGRRRAIILRRHFHPAPATLRSSTRPGRSAPIHLGRGARAGESPRLPDTPAADEAAAITPCSPAQTI